MKCRDQLEPESIQKCRGLCLNAELGAAENETTTNETSVDLETTLPPPHQLEPDINNEIINLLLPSSTDVDSERRPDTFVEDKIQPDALKVLEMQLVTADPSSSLIDSNAIEQADQPATFKKMAIHIGDDAANFLAKLQADQPAAEAPPPSLVDLSKMKPTFKWKIGLWTRVSSN